jgi:hypothetical protein
MGGPAPRAGHRRSFLGYVLPKREVAYITDAYNRFVEPGEIAACGP